MIFYNKIIKQPLILIFDSGVGGLSIYNNIKQVLPYADYLYVFDNIGFPYGEKKEYFIIERVLTIIYAIDKLYKLSLIIIACNTASTVSLMLLRESFSCPVIGVLPEIKLAVKLTCNGVIGLLATHATIICPYINGLLNFFSNYCRILTLANTQLVELAEAKLRGKIVSLSILYNLISPLLKPLIPDTIILGCTHFSLLKNELQKVLPKNILLVDSGLTTAYRSLFILKDYNIFNNFLKIKKNKNQVFCLAITPSVLTLVPFLLKQGFLSLKELKI